MNWYVIYTKPAAELKVAKQLQSQGIEAYCPSYTELRQWSDRKKKVRCPYFRSYVFVRVAAKDRNRVFSTAGVVRYLYWLGKPAIIRNGEMADLRNYLDGNTAGEVRIEQLRVGDRVSLASGILKDSVGVLDEIGTTRVRMILPALGCKVVVRIADLAAG